MQSPRGTQQDDRDGPLVETLRGRNADAAERLITTYQSRAYRLAVGITANAEDAEEVVQDAFLPAMDVMPRRSWPGRPQLPPHHRAALIMRDVQDWSCAEIAEVFGVSVGGVKTRLHRARLFIRKRLAESLIGRSSLGPAVKSPD
jgi:DNA-directed RNA polymerase specialized sigma24 family protein